MSKRLSKAGRAKGSRNALSAQDQQILSQALNLVFKKLNKRMDQLTDTELILFMTKLAPYGWAETIEPDDANKNVGRFITEAEKAARDKKPAAKTGAAKDSPKEVADKDKEIIIKALRIIVNTLCKKVDRLSNKNLIFFSALLVKYRYIPDMASGEEVDIYVTVGVAA